MPKFLVRGKLDATNCVISQPLTGELVVENSDVPIKSIELQLVRVETCGEFTVLFSNGTADGFFYDCNK